MLKPGTYIAEHHETIWDDYTIRMKVKETEKAYIFELESFDSRYSGVHIETLFSKSKKVILRKDKGGHAMRVWSERDFTLYPFQAGIPYWFKLQN